MNDPDDKWPMTVAYDGICRIDYPGGTWKNIPEVKGLVTIEYQPMDPKTEGEYLKKGEKPETEESGCFVQGEPGAK